MLGRTARGCAAIGRAVCAAVERAAAFAVGYSSRFLVSVERICNNQPQRHRHHSRSRRQQCAYQPTSFRKCWYCADAVMPPAMQHASAGTGTVGFDAR